MELSWGDRCFVCGADNADGLRLEFRVDPDRQQIETCWEPRPSHEGYDGIVHGGLVATVLDEAVGKLSTCLEMPAVTAELNVRFLRPVPSGRPLRVQGRLLETTRRILKGQAEAVLEDGTVAATATATLVRSRS